MSTTTLRMPDELKARIADVAKRTGVSAHHFMLTAVAEKTEQEERRAEFNALAEQRYAEIIETGETLNWHEVREYLQARILGQQLPRPVARSK